MQIFLYIYCCILLVSLKRKFSSHVLYVNIYFYPVTLQIACHLLSMTKYLSADKKQFILIFLYLTRINRVACAILNILRLSQHQEMQFVGNSVIFFTVYSLCCTCRPGLVMTHFIVSHVWRIADTKVNLILILRLDLLKKNIIYAPKIRCKIIS